MLGLSQSLNTVQVKKSFKHPKFSVVAKEEKQKQNKPVCNHEFGKTLPEVKEDILEDSTDERRETYVVTSSPAVCVTSTFEGHECLLPRGKEVETKDVLEDSTDERRETFVVKSAASSVARDHKEQGRRKNIDVSTLKNEKENNQQKEYLHNVVSSLPTIEKDVDANNMKNEKEYEEGKKQKEARAKWNTNSNKEQLLKEFKIQTSKLEDKLDQKVPIKPKVSASPAKRNVELVKNKVGSGVTKADKFLPKPVVFSVDPTIKKEKPKPKNHQKKSSLPRGSGKYLFSVDKYNLL